MIKFVSDKRSNKKDKQKKDRANLEEVDREHETYLRFFHISALILPHKYIFKGSKWPPFL